MIYELSDNKSTSRSLVCPLSALSPTSIRLCLLLSLAPGQGHCIITVQLQAG